GAGLKRQRDTPVIKCIQNHQSPFIIRNLDTGYEQPGSGCSVAIGHVALWTHDEGGHRFAFDTSWNFLDQGSLGRVERETEIGPDPICRFYKSYIGLSLGRPLP